MLDSNKSTNFNKKSHFKAFVYVSYDTYDFTIRYDSYDTHTVSYDSWTLTIRRYDTELFTHDTIHIVRYISRIVRYWQLCLGRRCGGSSCVTISNEWYLQGSFFIDSGWFWSLGILWKMGFFVCLYSVGKLFVVSSEWGFLIRPKNNIGPKNIFKSFFFFITCWNCGLWVIESERRWTTHKIKIANLNVLKN